ncbi:hypothetical protein THICB2_430039 [Thiomonas sp. CB2]|nr:hypothetical protein THICB2_430039 [Thiomonas sp. CB2]VDY04655.1 protein of unknown function [Thiomonas sp. Bio17B3]VDY08172.1 protein of unknown function [Thiomonas sp. Sup16B3]VDY12908.1 conserved protein of unknown function [Thiomonas sp. OC7]VDY17884.1 protein of unknown function [Thiomonas sp. CB2]
MLVFPGVYGWHSWVQGKNTLVSFVDGRIASPRVELGLKRFYQSAQPAADCSGGCCDG